MTETIKNTIKNLEKNNIKTYFCETENEIIPLLKNIIPKGASVGVGGSVTLRQLGVNEFLRSGEYTFFDREKANLTPEQISEIMAQTLTSDYFISSSNTVCESGELFNVDGRGNRVAALCYGPKKVIIIVGINKLVRDLNQAVERLKNVAAPKNAERLLLDTPCRKTGHCVNKNASAENMCSGCEGENRICSSYVITSKQMVKNRISVIICNQKLGY